MIRKMLILGSIAAVLASPLAVAEDLIDCDPLEGEIADCVPCSPRFTITDPSWVTECIPPLVVFP